MIRKIKSIQQLYEETKDFDIVITVDAPLRTALNKALKKPTLGTFAVNPKELASKQAIQTLGKPILDEPSIVLEVARRLRINIKQAHNYVSKIFEIWQEKGKPDIIKHYLRDDEYRAFNVIRNLPTLYLALEKFDRSFFNNKNVAVIGLDFFTELDKCILPENFTKIDIFTEDLATLSHFYLFPNEQEIVNKIAGLINPENANDIAIVLHTKSSYLPLIKSQLTNEGIPMNIAENLKDHFLTRSFLGIINIGLNLSNITIKDIKPFIELLSFDISLKYNNYLLDEYLNIANEELLNSFYSFIKDISRKTFNDAIKWFEENNINLPPELIDALYQLNILNENINFDQYADLVYYIENFDIEISHNKSGVLFIDCMNSMYIDRPVCFYLGMDSTWSKSSRKDWLDRATQIEKAIDIFQILIQQGVERYYFVSTIKDNQPVIPCYYFNILFDKSIDSFNDSIFSIKNLNNRLCTNEHKEDKEKINVLQPELRPFSQDTLNKFYSCPKRYMYDRLLPTEEIEYLSKGNLLHHFAEFYIHYPEIVNQKGSNFFIDIMIKEYSKFVENINTEIEMSNFRIGIDNIISFINGIKNSVNDDDIKNFTVHKKRDINIFSKELSVPLNKKNTEIEFTDEEFNISGKIDLIVNKNLMVDYKSSKEDKKPSEIMKESHIRMINKDVNFQPIMYILAMRKHFECDMKLVFHYCLANSKDIIKGLDNSKDILVVVNYRHENFCDFLREKSSIEGIKFNKQIEGFIKDIDLSGFFCENPLPRDLQFDEKKLFESDYFKKLEDYIRKYKKKVGKNLSENVKKLVKSIIDIRKNSATFFKDDVDEFFAFIKEKFDELQTYVRDKFPYKPLYKEFCEKCNYKDICLKHYEN